MVDTNFLASVPLFSSLDEDELRKLAQLFHPVTVNENDVIFKKGDLGDILYVIHSGTVKISVEGIHHEVVTLTSLESGDFFGELTLFDESPRTASAIALEKCELLILQREKFISFMKCHPEVAINMIIILGRRIRDSNKILERQATRNVNETLEQHLNFSERIADRFAEFIGSWTFILVFTFFVLLWMVLNAIILIAHPIDPFPFILLNLSLSCIAAIQGPVIMMSQGRQAKTDRITADLDYQVNLKAEILIQDILVKLNQIETKDIRYNNEMRQAILNLEKRLPTK